MALQSDEKEEFFGKRLRKFRKAAGLTQNQLAQELGVSRRIIDYYERESHQHPEIFPIDPITLYSHS